MGKKIYFQRLGIKEVYRQEAIAERKKKKLLLEIIKAKIEKENDTKIENA